MPGYSSSSESSSEDGNETSSSSEHPLVETNQDEEWEVDYIEDTRLVGDQRQYLIKYKGYEPSEWHGETAVENSELLVDAFLQSRRRIGSQRSDWIAAQIKALEEASEGEEEPQEEPQTSTSKVQEGLIIEFPIKKRKKKKKKKPKEHQEEQVNSDFADSSSSSSASSTSSISSSEESYRSDQDPDDKDYMSNYIPKMLEIRKSMESINLGWKKIKLEEMKAILSSQQVQQYMYFNEDFDHSTCDKNLTHWHENPQLIENNQPIKSSNHGQLNQAESSQINDQAKVKGKVKAKANGNGKERTLDKGKGKENEDGTDRTKGKGKGKERAREDDDQDQDQVEKLSPVVEEQESEDEAEVNNKRLKRKTTSGNLGEVKRKCLRRISTQT